MNLDVQHTDEQARTIRGLLAAPMTTRENDPELFRLIVIHRTALTDWFDTACGWSLHVDVSGGTARLVKRRAGLTVSRPATRPSDRQPFDQLRYVLVLTVAAELVSRPHTTISELADAVGTATATAEELPSFDAASQTHRRAFADVLLWLIHHGYATITAGALEQYATQGRDAVLEADVPRLATIPASVRPPSRIEAPDTDRWLDALVAEPRYGGADATDAQRNLHARHTIARSVLDDPALDTDDLEAHATVWLASLTGSNVTRHAVETAGMRLERSADVLVAVDESKTATGTTFADSASTVTQAVGVLLDELLDDDRSPRTRTRTELDARVAVLLDEDPGWAKGYQQPGGARRLAAAAVDELVAFGLVHLDGDEVRPRPAASRFKLTVTDGRPTGSNAEPSAVPTDGMAAEPPDVTLPFEEPTDL